MYKNETVFPCSNNINDLGIYNLYRAMSQHLFNRIPIHAFKTVILDFKDNIKDIYAYREGRLQNVGETEKLPIPSIVIEFVNNGNNYKDTQFASVSTPFQNYAGAEGINAEKRGLVAFYSDIYNIQLFSSNIFCKSNFNITFIVQTLDDRNNLANILDTNLKQHYGYEIENIKTQYLLPNALVNYLRKSLFKKEIDSIKEKQNTVSKETLTELSSIIDEEFVNHITGYSNGTIQLYNPKHLINNKDIRLAYTRGTNLYYKLDNEISIGDGEKRGELYDRYTITASGYIEYYNPIAFVLSLPSVIKGEWIDNYIIQNEKPDREYNLAIKKMNTIYTETREIHILKRKYRDYTMIFDEREFVCENGKDVYPVIFNLMELNKNDKNTSEIAYNFYQSIGKDKENIDINIMINYILNYTFENFDDIKVLDMVLFMIPHFSLDVIKELFYIVIWENDKLKDGNDYELSKDLNVDIYNTNSNFTYSFKLYANLIRIKTKFNLYFY